MKIEYDVEVKKSKAEDVNAFYKFLDSDKENMSITYDTAVEAKSRRQVFVRLIDKLNLDMTLSRIDETVTIIKN